MQALQGNSRKKRKRGATFAELAAQAFRGRAGGAGDKDAAAAAATLATAGGSSSSSAIAAATAPPPTTTAATVGTLMPTQKRKRSFRHPKPVAGSPSSGALLPPRRRTNYVNVNATCTRTVRRWEKRRITFGNPGDEPDPIAALPHNKPVLPTTTTLVVVPGSQAHKRANEANARAAAIVATPPPTTTRPHLALYRWVLVPQHKQPASSKNGHLAFIPHVRGTAGPTGAAALAAAPVAALATETDEDGRVRKKSFIKTKSKKGQRLREAMRRYSSSSRVTRHMKNTLSKASGVVGKGILAQVEADLNKAAKLLDMPTQQGIVTLTPDQIEALQKRQAAAAAASAAKIANRQGSGAAEPIATTGEESVDRDVAAAAPAAPEEASGAPSAE